MTPGERTADDAWKNAKRIARLETRLAALEAPARAAIAYDAAIQSCANDPEAMTSFCSAEGDDLDTLYAAWINAARAALDGDAP